MKNNKLKYWQNYRNISINCEDDLLFQVGKTVSSNAINDSQIDIIVEGIVKELQISYEDNILDLCCGNGFLTARIAKNAGFVLGVDFADSMLTNANKFNAMNNIEYLCHDVNNINEQNNIIRKNKINKVIISDALANFNIREFKNILKSLNQSLVLHHSIFLGNVLFKKFIWKFYNTNFRKLNYLINHKMLNKSKGLGTWWQINELLNIAKQFNYNIKIIFQNPQLSTAHYRIDLLLEK